MNMRTFQKCKKAHACALRDCLGVSRLFVSDTSPKCIDREGLERRRTETRQCFTIIGTPVLRFRSTTATRTEGGLPGLGLNIGDRLNSVYDVMITTAAARATRTTTAAVFDTACAKFRTEKRVHHRVQTRTRHLRNKAPKS